MADDHPIDAGDISLEVLPDDLHEVVSKELHSALLYIPFAHNGADFAGKVKFQVADGSETLTRYVVASKDSARVLEAAEGEAEACVQKCTINIQKDILLMILNGSLDPAMALICGQLQVDDLNGMKEFATAFDFDQASYAEFQEKLAAGRVSEAELLAGAYAADGDDGGAPGAADAPAADSDEAKEAKKKSEKAKAFLERKKKALLGSKAALSVAGGLNQINRKWNVAEQIHSLGKKTGLAKRTPAEQAAVDQERREEKMSLKDKLAALKAKNQQQANERKERMQAAEAEVAKKLAEKKAAEAEAAKAAT